VVCTTCHGSLCCMVRDKIAHLLVILVKRVELPDSLRHSELCVYGVYGIKNSTCVLIESALAELVRVRHHETMAPLAWTGSSSKWPGATQLVPDCLLPLAQYEKQEKGCRQWCHLDALD
jgi:hypothetical protein